jgi:D-glycero-alpha-D-manno-heptose-7-phosphate kinase
MLFYTGIKRTASTIAETYVNDIDRRRRQLRIMKDLVDEGLAVLNSRQDLTPFGELLHEAWQAKRSLSASVSNTDVDDLYNAAISAGAIGGKLTGAGGGGFLLLFVPPDRQEQVRARLDTLIHVPFRFEFSGSQVLFADTEQEYPREEEARARQATRAFRELASPAVATK